MARESTKGSFRRPSGPVAQRRLGLLAFGGLLVALFVGFAIAQGIGEPSVPSGDVVLVEGIPHGDVSQAKFDRILLGAAVQAGMEAPKPGDKQYEEVKESAIGQLLDGLWIRGEAEELGLSVSDKEFEAELAQIKEQNFPTPKAYEEYLQTSHLTEPEVRELIEIRMLTPMIQEHVKDEVLPPSSEAVSAYYEATKDTQFTTKPSRDVRFITNADQAKVRAAQKALEADSSPANWRKVASKYSEDALTNKKGGLQEDLVGEILAEPLKEGIFGAAVGELVGPTKFQGNYTLTEVVKRNPEETQSLDEVKPQIESQLRQNSQEELFAEFLTSYQQKWTARTLCAENFATDRCANFKGDGHPVDADPACYEADPKTPATECPAPVTQLAPAVPGSVTLLQPQGERLPQRPRPGPNEGGSIGEEGMPLPAEDSEAP